jgi:hypothetical protein
MGMDNHLLHQPDPASAQVQGDHPPLHLVLHHHLDHLQQLELPMEQEAFRILLQRELEYEAWDLIH